MRNPLNNKVNLKYVWGSSKRKMRANTNNLGWSNIDRQRRFKEIKNKIGRELIKLKKYNSVNSQSD